MPDTDPSAPTPRHDGWTAERTARFLDSLAAKGNVRLACRRAGMSPEAAYRFKRRDPTFARGWAAALVLAHDGGLETLTDRAIDGVEEPVWYRGELVGTRRRYDARLLLAHLARLDALAESGTAREDAGRFDELVALAGGVVPPAELACDDDGLPLARAACVAVAVDVAVAVAREEAEDAGSPESGELSPAACFEAGAEAAAAWDAWLDEARATVDRMVRQPAEDTGAFVNPASTSPLANALARGQPSASV